MKEFVREDRYIVIKRQDLLSQEIEALEDYIAQKELRTRECVVVEPDWPIYEDVWKMVEGLDGN